jgi:hypothetical protein
MALAPEFVGFPRPSVKVDSPLALLRCDFDLLRPSLFLPFALRIAPPQTCEGPLPLIFHALEPILNIGQALSRLHKEKVRGETVKVWERKTILKKWHATISPP